MSTRLVPNLTQSAQVQPHTSYLFNQMRALKTALARLFSQN